MAFSMSGVSDGYSYNRFDIYEKKSKDCGCKSEKECDCDDKKAKGKGGKEPRWQDSDGDGKWYEPGEDVAEGMMPLPKEKMERQSNKAYAKEVVAANHGKEKEANKQMQRRIAMNDPSGRKNQLMNKEEVEQDGPKPTPGQAAGAQKNILSKLRLLKNKQGEETTGDKQQMALQKARAKAFGMKEEKAESERSDAMPAGDVGHDIHKRAVKSYNKNNPSTKVKEDYGYSEVYEARKEGEEPQAYADRMKKKHSGGKSKTYDPMKDSSFDHDEAEKTRGQSGKMKQEELEATGLFSEEEISVILEALLGKN
tara:strand:+ start:788 stop:1717 length:930 start_codon:yes stop_codon:yes gene_type:complete